MAMMQEFREFAVKGNVVDPAVVSIQGAVSGEIAASMGANLYMPALQYSHLAGTNAKRPWQPRHGRFP